MIRLLILAVIFAVFLARRRVRYVSAPESWTIPDEYEQVSWA